MCSGEAATGAGLVTLTGPIIVKSSDLTTRHISAAYWTIVINAVDSTETPACTTVSGSICVTSFEYNECTDVDNDTLWCFVDESFERRNCDNSATDCGRTSSTAWQYTGAGPAFMIAVSGRAGAERRHRSRRWPGHTGVRRVLRAERSLLACARSAAPSMFRPTSWQVCSRRAFTAVHWPSRAAVAVLNVAGGQCGTLAGEILGTVTLDLATPVLVGGATGVTTFDGTDLTWFMSATMPLRHHQLADLAEPH